ncbi:hypothetical protein HDR59_02395 [bacterium]|nr:hypothetical protein [bacterium]
MLKINFTLIPVLLLAACSIPTRGEIENANVYHWENNNVVMAKFIEDHKACLGVKYTKPRSRIQNLMDPMTPYTIPKWDGMWATFESRGHREVGQRIAFSVPSNTSVGLESSYKKCMINLGYRLTYKR